MLTPTTALRASVYQNFRVPMLNEQYRVFRVRSDVTMAERQPLGNSFEGR